VQKIKLSNFIEKSVTSTEIPFYLKDHTNSLNLNITNGLIETSMEALKIFRKDMDDGEPYKIFNRSGYPLELRDVKKDSSLRRLNENVAIEWQGWRDLYF
jgi:vacuolar protein sorting-associated protein 13A/C